MKLGPNTPPSIVSPRPGSSTGNAGNTGNTGNTSGNTTPTQTEMVSGSAPAPKPCPKPKGNAVTAKSPGFNKWLDDALREYGDWDMPVFKNKYGETITPRDYVKAIIHIESSGIHRKSNGAIITSCCGAQGFMQLMPDTAKYLKIANPADPAQNILGGVKLFKQIFTSRYIGKKSGLEKLIMAGCAYNIGPYSKKLANSWESNLANNRGAVGYGLKLKMSLGFKLTAQERDYVAKHMARGKSVDAYADSQYAYAKGIGM